MMGDFNMRPHVKKAKSLQSSIRLILVITLFRTNFGPLSHVTKLLPNLMTLYYVLESRR